MSNELSALIEKAKRVEMTDKERETQRISFVFGNTHFENATITRDTVTQAAKKLDRGED